jgi:hypothetical protein
MLCVVAPLRQLDILPTTQKMYSQKIHPSAFFRGENKLIEC